MIGDELYQEQILDHYHHPHNFGDLPGATEKASGANLSCGDEISFAVKYQDKTIADIKFTGNSCAICTAAASMLTDEIVGKSLSEISSFDTIKMQELLGLKLSPIRLKCALLPLQTLKSLKRVRASQAQPTHAQN